MSLFLSNDFFSAMLCLWLKYPLLSSFQMSISLHHILAPFLLSYAGVSPCYFPEITFRRHLAALHHWRLVIKYLGMIKLIDILVIIILPYYIFLNITKGKDSPVHASYLSYGLLFLLIKNKLHNSLGSLLIRLFTYHDNKYLS